MCGVSANSKASALLPPLGSLSTHGEGCVTQPSNTAGVASPCSIMSHRLTTLTVSPSDTVSCLG